MYFDLKTQRELKHVLYRDIQITDVPPLITEVFRKKNIIIDNEPCKTIQQISTFIIVQVKVETKNSEEKKRIKQTKRSNIVINQAYKQQINKLISLIKIREIKNKATTYNNLINFLDN